MSRRRDLMQLLSESRPTRLDPGESQLDLATLTAYPPQEPAQRAARPAARRRLVLTAGLVPALAVGALAVAVVVHQPAPTPRPEAARSVTPQSAAARQFLLAAADRVAGSEAGSGQYWQINMEVGDVREVGPANGRYDIAVRMGVEDWLATDPDGRSWTFFQRLGGRPISAADLAAWRRDGSPARWGDVSVAPGPRRLRTPEGVDSRQNYFLGSQSVTAAELTALPADPAALQAELSRRHADSQESRTEFLFWSGTSLVLDLPVSPEMRAAAYRMIAGLDGVTSLGAVTDQLGRTGVAIAYARRGDGGVPLQTRLILDPRTGRALAEETWRVGVPDRLVHYRAIVEAGWTDANPPTA
ncbi:CU044_5270 family protein [Micromonospora sp. 4G57]|uniref:CU044_5270 family protein n=1 Tax=Micromonospora sicca TaxID=2202420 RepID=A0ABU5JFI6_9ACTN|nr:MULTISPECIES: CU044_5270 family protein [unclassified Micromonospora]MDZ5441139.1 CU044_5270 family protein [Micromonospora sp. 4G57]MDZ5491365.1 CU044_5270 family protein [Micromonospora sp. 4G53]